MRMQLNTFVSVKTRLDLYNMYATMKETISKLHRRIEVNYGKQDHCSRTWT